MSHKIINIGLVGYGLGGRVFHAPIIAAVEGLRLKTIAVKDVARAESADAQYPDTQVVPNAEQIFKDDAIDVVVIATPNSSHFPLAKAALLHGKHVVVEKPFTINTTEADELIALAEKQERIITVHQNRRWDSDYLTVKKIIESSVLGNLVEYEAHFDRFRNAPKNTWKEQTDVPGNGMLYDLGAHLIDQALSLFGMPQAVTADIRIQRQGATTPDNFELILHYPTLKVTLKCGMLVRGDLPHFILLGQQGSFIKYGMDVQEEVLKAGHAPHEYETPPWGVEPENIWGTINTDVNGLHITGKVESEPGDYRQFYRNLYNAVLGKEPIAISTQQARNTIHIIELAMQSQAEQRTVRM